MKKLKKILAIACVAALLTSVAACAPKVSNNTSKTEPTASTVAPDAKVDPAQLKAEIKFWSFPNFEVLDDTPGKYEKQLIVAFNEKYPNIKVDVEMIDFASGPEKITNAIQGGTVCDVLLDAPGRIVQWGKDGVLAPLNGMFTDELLKDVNNDSILDACKSGNDYWMYPISSAPFLMAFNKEMLEKDGLLNMLPTSGDRTWTMDQYEALLKALKAKGENGAVFYCSSQGGDQGTRAYIANLFNSSIMNSDRSSYTINNESGVKALDWTVNAIKNGWLQNGSASDGTAAIDEFVAGRASHTLLFSPGLRKVKSAPLAKSGITPIFMPFPSVKGSTALEFLVDGWCVFDNHNTDKIAASKLFIDFASNDATWGVKNIKATNTFPIRQSFGNLYEGNADMTYLAGLTKYYAPYYNTVNGFAQMRTAWFPAMQAAIGGQKSSKAALDEFVNISNKALKE